MRVTVLALVALAASAATAQADVSIDVSPLRFEIHADPGAEYTNAVRIENNGHEAVRLRAFVEDWSLDDEGTPRFEPAGSALGSVCSWISLAPSDFLIQPGQTRSVRFTVQVPAEAAARGYHGALMLESLPLRRADETGRRVFVNGRVACMLYLTVGEVVRSAEIASLSTVVRDGKPRLRIQVRNTGDVHIRIAGDVAFGVPGAGEGELVALPDVPVLPGASRWVEVEIPPGGLDPKAVAHVTIDVSEYGRLVGEWPLAVRAAMGN